MAETLVNVVKGVDRMIEQSANTSVYNFQITRTGDTSASSSVSWSVTGFGPDPVNAADFEFSTWPSGSVTFAPGETSKNVGFRVVADRTFEADEGFAITLRNPTGATIGTAQVTAVIRNDDAQPPTGNDPGKVIDSPGPGSTLVGTGGPDTFNASQGSDQIVSGEGADVFRWSVAPWSPAQITDFQVGVDRLDFSQLLQAAGYTGSDPVADGYIRVDAAGQSSTRVFFDSDAGGSGQQWPTQVVILNGVPAQGITWSQLSQGGGSAPEATVGFNGGSIGVAEGNSGARVVNFNVGRFGDTSGQTTVNYSVSGSGSAPADSADFYGGLMASSTLTFQAGETAKTIAVWISGDTFAEQDESYAITLSGVQGGRIGNATATGFIYNDDAGTSPPPAGNQVLNSPGPGSTLTGGGGDDTLNASRGSDVLTGGAGRDLFSWAAEPWSPARVTDFAVGTDRLDLSRVFQTFGYSGSDPVADRWISFVDDGAGGTKVLFDHDGTGPNPQWPNYIIQLEKVSAAGLTWSQLSGAGSPPPPPGPSSVSIYGVRADHAEGDTGSLSFSFNLQRSGDLSAGVTVNWAAAPSGANPASASDFAGGVVPSGQVVFAAGEGSKIVPVNIAGDTVVEPDETFTVSITGVSAGTVGAGSVNAVIRNDDAQSPPPDDGQGRVINSARYGDVLTGGSGADTLNAGQGPDQLTGWGGADRFVYQNLPWNAGKVTDFTPGTDVLDLRPLFQAAGYTGTDPIADQWLEFRIGGGGTQVYFDRDGPGGADWPFLITTLDRILPSALDADDWMFR